MTITDFRTEADLVGRRVCVRWTVVFDPGETLADEPDVRLRRKENDFQFPPPGPGGSDPYRVYDSTAFPPAGIVRELPSRESYDDAGRRTLEVVVTVSVPGDPREVEILRRTERTLYAATGEVLQRQVEVIDVDRRREGLTPGTTYYYELTSSAVSPAPGQPPWRDTAMPGEGYGIGARLYQMLPGIQQRHDTVRRPATPGAEAIPEAAPTGGQLRRFIDVFGAGADALRSSAEGLREIRDLDTADHRYLPLLARWIGWDLSFDAPVPNRRHEIKFAPALYQLTGTIASAQIWVQFATGWASRVKEYVHNVFRTNQPADLNVWLRTRAGDDTWSEPEQPVRLDAAHQGRPAAASTPDGTLWLAYHTFRMNRWGVWIARYTDEGGWSASEPLSDAPGIDKAPAMAALPDGRLWVVWPRHHGDRWRLVARIREADGRWGDPFDLAGDLDAGGGAASVERKDPALAVDPNGDLWLFWREGTGSGWRMRYSRHSGGTWAPAVDVPDASAARADAAPSVVAAPDGSAIWVAWSRKESSARPGATQSVIVVRAKTTLAPDAGGWQPERVLSVTPPEHHDTDPALYVAPGGEVAVAFASDRDDRFAIYLRTYDAASDAWEAAQSVPAAPAGQRHPRPIIREGDTWLFYRSARPPVYESDQPSGIRSLDFRYTGSVTPSLRHSALLLDRGEFHDALAYTHDAGPSGGRTGADRIAADTVGLFLEPTTADVGETLRDLGRIRQVARYFVPAIRRAVYDVPEDVLPDEYVYAYDAPLGVDAPLLTDAYADTLTSTTTEAAPTPTDAETASVTAVSDSTVPPPTDASADTYTTKDFIRAESLDDVPRPDDEVDDEVDGPGS
jgi:phage tail-like protein